MDKLIKAVITAVGFYGEDHCDVVLNEKGNLDVIYHKRVHTGMPASDGSDNDHSHNNSFPVVTDVVPFDKVDKAALVKELDARHVGYCF